MISFVQEFIEKTQEVQSLDELSNIFTKIVEKMGFNEWAYQLNNSSSLTITKPVIVANYSDEWIEYYIENDYSSVDPVIIKGPDELMPFRWNELTQKTPLTSKQKTLFNEASDYGIGEGIGIPIHGVNKNFAMVSMVSAVNDEETTKILHEQQSQIHTLSLIYHSLAKDLVSLGQTYSRNYNLTNREKECLLWVAQGKTTWDISSILRISERTVIFHIENAKNKLGASNRYHAVVKAIMNKVISI